MTEVGKTRTLSIRFLYRTYSTLIICRTVDTFSLSILTYIYPLLSYLIIKSNQAYFWSLYIRSTHEVGCWRPRWNNELYSLYKEPNILEDIKIRRLEWAGHIIRMEEERIPKKGSKWKLPYHKTSGKTKNEMGGCGSE